jgi:hypothetical protein
MRFLPDNTAVRDAAVRLRGELTTPGLSGAVAAYFDPRNGLAGMSFHDLGANPPNQVTADDLLAVSLLDITWRPEAVRELLGAKAEKISAMLEGITSEAELWDVSDAEIAAVDPLRDALQDTHGIGPATASKLLARKRPRLCAVTGKVVIRAAGVSGRTWETLRCLLQDPGARGEVEALRSPHAANASLLRILEVAIWLCHSPSTAARQLREGAGVPEPG